MRRSVPEARFLRPAVLVLCGALASALPAAAQLARPRTTPADAPKLLILPFIRDNVDSALSLVVADGVRERMRTAYIDRFNTITRENLCRNLTESGFPCDVPLDQQTARTLVRFLNAKLVIDGSMIRTHGDSMIVVARLSEANGNPPTAVTWAVAGSRARTGSSTGGELANRLVDGYRSFDEVTECKRRLDLGNLAGAAQKADDALRQFPGNAGAWVCKARILEAQNAPADSVLRAFRNAYERDTLNPAVMRLLASRYQAKSDTSNLLDMLKRILTIDSRDNDLRINTIRLMAQMGQFDSAVALANKGLVENPASADLLGAKAIAMAAGNHFDSAAAAMISVSEIDSSKVDSLFIYRLTNYLRQVPDTANLLVWCRNATVKFPTQAPYFYTLAELSWARGDSAGAIAAARGYSTLRPDDGRGHLALARYLVQAGQVDSALIHAAAVQDSALTPFTGPIFLSAGLRAYRDSSWSRAIELLQQAKDRSAGQQVIRASFYLGLSQAQFGRVIDAQADSSKNCDLSRQSQDLWNNAEQNIIAGARENVNVANQLLSQLIPAYKQRAEALVHNNCR